MVKCNSTRHKEYSIILAFVAISFIFILGSINNFLLITLLNIIAIASILYSAISAVRHADVLAHRFGEPYGSMILSISIVILETSLISILMLSGVAKPTLMRDTLYSVVMIVTTGLVGLSLLLGGRKFSSQYFNLSGISQFLIAIIPMLVIVLILPGTLAGQTFNKMQLLAVSLICLLTYFTFLIIQTKTHQDFFIYKNEDGDNSSNCDETNFSTHSSMYHGIFLLVHLTLVIFVTKINTGILDSFLAGIKAPPAFTGFLVAVLILSPEGLGGIKAALDNQVQRAMNIFLGSVVASMALTVPAVILIAFLKGQQLVFGLSASGIVLLAGAMMLSQSTLSSGRTNVLSGMTHIVMFIAYFMLLLK